MNDYNEYRNTLKHSAIIINRGESVIEHADHKYINKFMKGGKWIYEYASDAAKRAGKEISDTASATKNYDSLKKKENHYRDMAKITDDHRKYLDSKQYLKEMERSGGAHVPTEQQVDFDKWNEGNIQYNNAEYEKYTRKANDLKRQSDKSIQARVDKATPEAVKRAGKAVKKGAESAVNTAKDVAWEAQYEAGKLVDKADDAAKSAVKEAKETARATRDYGDNKKRSDEARKELRESDKRLSEKADAFRKEPSQKTADDYYDTYDKEIPEQRKNIDKLYDAESRMNKSVQRRAQNAASDVRYEARKAADKASDSVDRAKEWLKNRTKRR